MKAPKKSVIQPGYERLEFGYSVEVNVFPMKNESELGVAVCA